MQREPQIVFWRRTDIAGLERLALSIAPDALLADATVLCMEDGGFRLDHHWRLTPDWRALSLRVERWGPAGHVGLELARSDGGWSVNGMRRADLDGADEPDLSVTPFCNTFPIRRTPIEAGLSLTLDTCYVDAAATTVARSRQRYDRLGPRRLRYVDCGLSAGFEAELTVDDQGLVLSYEHLFERIAPI
ncbi:putative glycolipid-binding domain-containing protein [Roseiarcaceae bacterium H3SJ34-1]|uniref:putative glycolipid-binding domain-containing protein n=1 Tax=Terripilifer ovatus TaxID=3032367 RepID=UPI003AB9705D|nr:putative glycolipid-binding domain-containing protein [Roseiarcaceae bacterium H3SJ34-1]